MSPSISGAKKIVISGGSGFIGGSVARELRRVGWSVTCLTRNPKLADSGGYAFWDPERGVLDKAVLDGCDVVLNTAGESIMGIWTGRKRARILASRINSARLLCETIAKLDSKPKTVISTSGCGIYALRNGDAPLDESGALGEGFLFKVARDWEAEFARLPSEIRFVALRLGIVMGSKGGFIKRALPLFRLGLGATVGKGDNKLPWIAIDDLVRLIPFIIDTPQLSGPVNAVSPNVNTQADFTRALAKAVRRPAIWQIPPKLAYLVLREFVTEELLTDRYMVPQKLLDAGFDWSSPELEPLIRAQVG